VGVGTTGAFPPEMRSPGGRTPPGAPGPTRHAEPTMSSATPLAPPPAQGRASRDETPAGGLTPMGVHAVDGMIDLCGEIDHVYCQSFRRAVEIDSDDTTSMLFRMKGGMSGYLGTMTATGPGFSFQAFGLNGSVRFEGWAH